METKNFTYYAIQGLSLILPFDFVSIVLTYEKEFFNLNFEMRNFSMPFHAALL